MGKNENDEYISEEKDFEVYSLEDVAEDANDEPDEEPDDEPDEDFDEIGDSDEFEDRFRRMLDEKARKKRSRVFTAVIIIVSAAAVAAIAALFCFTDTGLIGAYKKNFERNFKKLFPEMTQPIDIGVTEKDSSVQEYVNEDSETRIKITARSTENVKMIPFEGASSGRFAAYQGGLICTRTNYICFVSGDGAVQWEQKTTVVDPLLSVDGRYVAIASENGTKLCLYNGKTLVFERNTEDKIKSIRVSSGGDVVLVCDKANYKGAVSVYNKDGQEIFAWSSGQNSVISADISSASRRVAAVLLNADKQVYSIIKVFDISSSTDSVETAFDDTILFRADYTGDTITALGDNSLVCMTSTGRVICDKRFDMVDISHYSLDAEGNKLIHFDSAGVPVFHIYGKKGALNSEIIVDHHSDCIDINGSYILYNSGRSVLLRRTGSDRINEYTATMDILNLILINKNTYAVVHSNSIEIVKI